MLGTLGHQIDATGPEKGVCFHRPQSERGIVKIKSTRGQSNVRGWNFVPVVRVGV